MLDCIVCSLIGSQETSEAAPAVPVKTLDVVAEDVRYPVRHARGISIQWFLLRAAACDP